jgi:hypothetical protein
MRTKILLISLLTLGFATMQAQAGATVYAKNSDISDNLDLRAVASIFGESANLQDFERRLNEPKYQISNLDLNDDNQVDYLRVIESVENRTHVVIIQAVLDRDVYQDVATIDLERDSFNKVHIQVVGNDFIYGSNYIYEPVYTITPVIYTSFWVTNYRPYYSSWTWNYYPTYYTAWRPYPVYRYRNNVNICINVNNHYNYVSSRRSNTAVVIYNSNRTYGYERRNPNNGFAQRNSNVNNRYELDQRRVATRETNRRGNTYSNTNRTTDRTATTNRDYTQNRTNTSRDNNTTARPSRDYSQNRTNSTGTTVDRTNSTRDYNRGNTTSRTETTRDYSQNRTGSTAVTPTPRTQTTRDYTQNRTSSPTVTPTQRTESSRDYTQNRGSATRDYSTQRTESSRGNSESRTSSARQSNPQSSGNDRSGSVSRGDSSQRQSGSGERSSNRRG